MAPSAYVGNNFAYFEPVHGTAWDLTGKEVADPIASILSGKMMLEWLGMNKEAWYVETAVKEFLKESETVTPDLDGKSSTSEVGDTIARLVMELEKERGAFEKYLYDINSDLLSIEQVSVHNYKRTDIITSSRTREV